jgi:hypothetical protein
MHCHRLVSRFHNDLQVDPEDDERRAQAVKAERLKNSELFGMKGQVDESSGACIFMVRRYSPHC